MKRIILLLLFFVVLAANAQVFRGRGNAPSTGLCGATPNCIDVSCSGTIDTPLNAAINASTSNTTPLSIVNIGAGSCTLANALNYANKNITIRGQGQGVTTIQADNGIAAFNATGTNTLAFRFSAMSFNVNSVSGVIPIVVGGFSQTGITTELRGGFRIDHININYQQPAGHCIYFYGIIWGLIDHNNFTSLGGVCALTDMEYGSEDGASVNTLLGAQAATMPYVPGHSRYLYYEDNTFTCNEATGNCTWIDTAYTGCRVVFRHNTVANGFLYSHWTSSGNVNSCWWEMYKNSFTNTNAMQVVGRMQGGGTGLIYNNLMTGYTSKGIEVGEGRLNNQSGYPVNYCDTETLGQNPSQGFISGTTMTILTAGHGAGWFVGAGVNGASGGTVVTVGSGGAGTYTVNNSQTLGSMGAPVDLTPVSAPGPQTFDSNLGDASAVGWPCYTQVGRQVGPTPAQIAAGTKQTSFPMYAWANGPQASCLSGTGSPACDNSYGIGISAGSQNYVLCQDAGSGACSLLTVGTHNTGSGNPGNGDVDVCVANNGNSQPTSCGTHTLTYTPWTYPYPLNSDGIPVP